MLLDQNLYASVTIGYLFHFDNQVSLDDLGSGFPSCVFKGYCSRCSCPERSEERTCDKTKGANSFNILKDYKEVVEERIRREPHRVRRSFLVEIDLPLLNIKFPLSNAESDTFHREGLRLQGLVILRESTISSIFLWISGVLPTTHQQWVGLCDPSELSIIYRFNNNEIKNTVSKFALTIAERYMKPPPAQLDGYRFFFIECQDSKKMQRAYARDPRDIRLALCQDMDWAQKPKNCALIHDMKLESRDSIIWIADSECTVEFIFDRDKADSKKMMMGMLIETDIVLAMRHFLRSGISKISSLEQEDEQPANLKALHYALVAEMEWYCNVQVAPKDTTRRRIARLKRVFYVDEIYKSLEMRFSLLSAKADAIGAFRSDFEKKIIATVGTFLTVFNVLDRVLDGITQKGSVAAISIVSAVCVSVLIWRGMGTISKRYTWQMNYSDISKHIPKH